MNYKKIKNNHLKEIRKELTREESSNTLTIENEIVYIQVRLELSLIHI